MSQALGKVLMFEPNSVNVSHFAKVMYPIELAKYRSVIPGGGREYSNITDIQRVVSTHVAE